MHSTFESNVFGFVIKFVKFVLSKTLHLEKTMVGRKTQTLLSLLILTKWQRKVPNRLSL